MQSITDRIGHLASLAPEQRRVTPPVPKSVKIELTGRCDFQCCFCASHTRPRARSDMPWEVYTRRVRELRELGVEQPGMFYLGESFMEAWNSEPFVKLRAAHLKKDVIGTVCEKCVAYQ